MAELVEALDARIAPRAVSDQQHPDRFHVAISSLRHTAGPAAQRRSSGLHRVEAVGLAVTAPGLTIRAINLDHRHPCGPQRPGQAGPIGTGAFHPDPAQRAEAAQPGVQVGEPAGGRRERLDAECAAVGVERGGDVNIEVGVNPAGDWVCLYDGHSHPFSLQVG
jgi:hypothetical protein